MEASTIGYLQRSLQDQAQLPVSPLIGLNRLRGEALERANALHLPSTRDENWRFTDLSPLYQSAFQAVRTPASFTHVDLAPHLIPEAGARLVFVDGIYVHELSAPSLEVSSLVREAQGHEFVVRESLAEIARFDDEVFTAVNTAWLQDAAVVRIGRDVDVERPVHLLFVSSTPSAAAYPRVLVVAAAGSRCTVIEDYVALHAASGLTNSVCEIDLAPGAQMRHIRLQRESSAAFHIGTCAVRSARDSHYAGVNVALG